MILSLAGGMTIVGLSAVGITKLQRRSKKSTLITALTPVGEAFGHQHPTLKVEGSNSLVTSLVKLDNRYQQFLQRRIDFLISGSRHAQWQEISGRNALEEISAEDQMYNRSIARMGGVLVTAGLARIYTPFLLLTILLAFYDLYVQGRWVIEGARSKKKLTMEHLAIVFIAGLWLSGYFVVGSLSLLAFNLVIKMTLQSQDRSRKEMTNILGSQPHFVWVLVDGVEMEIPFEQLQLGDLLVVQAGQTIPVDGAITYGNAAVDQHRLTGESQPVEKSIGDPVLAATVVLSGKIHIEVQKTGQATLAAKIGDVLANTLDYHLSIEERGREIADGWVVPSIVLTGLAGVTLGFRSAVAVLSNMPGIDFMFLAPISLLNYLNIASRNNILIKDGRSLELLKKVDTVVFDKTGTLTLEQPHVKTVHLCVNIEKEINVETVLSFAAAAEQRQQHPIAKAIIDAAEKQSLTLPPIDDVHYELGHGLRVWLAVGEEQAEEWQLFSEKHQPDQSVKQRDNVSSSLLVHVGSPRFIEAELIAIPAEILTVQKDSQEFGHSLVMVAVNYTLVGAIELEPSVRPEAHAVIKALHERNIATAIISGDQEAPTRTLAKKLGIEQYFANVLPEEKATFVAKLQSDGNVVCFVGDGINDAIALKQAEVSISLRGATMVATDTAQIILMDETLKNLPMLFELSQNLDRNLTRGLVLVTVPCSLVVVGIFFFHIGVPLAVTVYTGTFTAGVINAMLPVLGKNSLTADSSES